MSLNSWRAEFYPVSAAVAASREDDVVGIVEHSLKKWIGLRRANTDAHDTYISKGGSLKDENGWMALGSASCSLCQAFESSCGSCPLSKVRSDVPCDESRRRHQGEEPASPWDHWLEHRDPEPMIAWLQATLEMVTGQTVNLP